MVKKNGQSAEIETEVNEDTAAADTIKAHPSDASKAGLMAKMMGAMAVMDNAECSKWMDQALALIGHEADQIPSGTAENNAASIAMKGAVKEDVAALFGSEELTEEFKDKAATLFEAALSARLIAERAVLEEEFDNRLNEEIELVVESLTESVDQYISYAAQEWAKENEVAIERSLRVEVAESFMDGLRSLFNEHWATIPEDKVDVVEALVDEIETLKTRLNETVKDTIDLASIVEDYTKKEIFNEVTGGLALTQVDKLRPLIESVDFESAESYKSKLEVIKEGFLKTAATSGNRPTSFITEDLDIPEPQGRVDPQIASYAKTIARTVKK